MDARISRKQKKVSAKQEQRMAKDLGGRVQPASGALKTAKSDVRAIGVVRGEAKYTAKAIYTLKRADLDKIVGEAGLERAVLQLCFVDRANKPIATFAISPSDSPLHERDTWAEWADLQTFGKSCRIYRDKTFLRLLKQGRILIAFSTKIGDEFSHQWYQITNWDDYLASMEEPDA